MIKGRIGTRQGGVETFLLFRLAEKKQQQDQFDKKKGTLVFCITGSNQNRRRKRIREFAWKFLKSIWKEK